LEKILPPELEIWTVQTVDSRHTDCAIPAHAMVHTTNCNVRPERPNKHFTQAQHLPRKYKVRCWMSPIHLQVGLSTLHARICFFQRFKSVPYRV
jgi:hypothetical protein